MELAFETEALRDVCEDEAKALTEFGNEVATALIHRLADLRAARTVTNLVTRDRRVERVEARERYVVPLANEKLLYLQANHVKNPTGRDGYVDWSRVSRVKVMRIGPKDD
jgi:hypothetical protein